MRENVLALIAVVLALVALAYSFSVAGKMGAVGDISKETAMTNSKIDALDAKVTKAELETERLRGSVKALEDTRPGVAFYMWDVEYRMLRLVDLIETEKWLAMDRQVESIDQDMSIIAKIRPDLAPGYRSLSEAGLGKMRPAIQAKSRSDFEQAWKSTYNACQDCHKKYAPPGVAERLEFESPPLWVD
ncbi:MAG: hypothetical protein HY555_06315 [Euryarchaeota archaeon]|nr:hypothetical protein [Euryarchaeota archaeon]